MPALRITCRAKPMEEFSIERRNKDAAWAREDSRRTCRGREPLPNEIGVGNRPEASARQDSNERKLAKARPEKSMSADDGDSHRHKRNRDGKQSRILKTWTNGFAVASNPCAVNVPRGSQSREFFEVFEAPRNLPCEL